MNIADNIGIPALLEQTAEECCELAQACLKMARKLRDENPTPKSIEDIRDNLVEEIADVELCMDELVAIYGLVSVCEIEDIKEEKHKRWQKRLNIGVESGEVFGEKSTLG